MPKDDTSVAPKERVNIRYKAATSGAEGVELPLKMLFVGDYTGRKDDTPVAERKPIDVKKDSFNDVLEQQKLAVDLSVPDRLSGEEDARMAVHLEFNSLKDFEPDGVAAQVPELRKLLDLRKALVALKGPLGNIPAFRKTIQGLLRDDAARAQLITELNIGSGPKDK